MKPSKQWRVKFVWPVRLTERTVPTVYLLIIESTIENLLRAFCKSDLQEETHNKYALKSSDSGLAMRELITSQAWWSRSGFRNFSQVDLMMFISLLVSISYWSPLSLSQMKRRLLGWTTNIIQVDCPAVPLVIEIDSVVRYSRQLHQHAYGSNRLDSLVIESIRPNTVMLEIEERSLCAHVVWNHGGV